MILAGVVVFLAIAAILVVFRRQFAHMQSMLFGATLPIGCVTVQASMFVALAAIVYVYREWLE